MRHITVPAVGCYHSRSERGSPFPRKKQARQIEQEKMKTAWNMLREHVPADIISKCTGLSQEAVEQLRNGG